MEKESGGFNGKITDPEDKDDLLKRLSHSYRMLQYIIEHDHNAIAVLNRELKYIFVSQRFLTDYNVREKDILERSHYEVFPTLPEKWKEVHKRALAGEVLTSDDDSFENENGELVWVRWECRPWYQADDSIGGIILYTEVITEQKEAEMELINAKEKAEESDRLKTAFLQNISHEVRTPLNSIVGFAELLSEPGQSLQKMNSFSKIISANSQKLIRIISDFIEISQVQSKQVHLVMSHFDVVSSLYRTANTFLEITQLKDVGLVIDQQVPEDQAIIESDKGKVEKIFFHLIDNAVKFTPKGAINLIISLEAGRLHFSIKDTGIGIPFEKQEIIFDPFRQIETGLNRSYGGTGLGLTIVKAYVDSLKGEISLKSELNQGTEITLSIPVKTVPASGKQPQRDHDHEHVNTILIAEDEYSNFKYLYEVLHSDNVEILHASNGREAVDLCKKSNDINLVLMDLKMPVMDGTAAAKKIKEFRPELPIIAQTAYIPEEETINSVFTDLIAKPINRNDLKEKMSKYLDVPIIAPH